MRWQDLDESLRRFLAWDSILKERNELNLDPHQASQAETQLRAADETVAVRLPEAYQWLLAPEQSSAEVPMTWAATKLSGSGGLAERATKRLRNDELLLRTLGATILRKHMDDVPLWRENHVVVRELVTFFAQYVYLPRLAGPQVLMDTIQNGGLIANVGGGHLRTGGGVRRSVQALSGSANGAAGIRCAGEPFASGQVDGGAVISYERRHQNRQNPMDRMSLHRIQIRVPTAPNCLSRRQRYDVSTVP